MLSTQSINEIIQRIIEREGGYVDHPSDPGGETKYGISKRSYPGEDIRNLTVERATELYRRDYVEKHGIDKLDSARTAELVVDWVVHSGTLGIRKLQQKLNVPIDGIMGPQTIQALNNMQDPRKILLWRLDFLIGLTGHPFIRGWVKRLVELGL